MQTLPDLPLITCVPVQTRPLFVFVVLYFVNHYSCFPSAVTSPKAARVPQKKEVEISFVPLMKKSRTRKTRNKMEPHYIQMAPSKESEKGKETIAASTTTSRHIDTTCRPPASSTRSHAPEVHVHQHIHHVPGEVTIDASVPGRREMAENEQQHQLPHPMPSPNSLDTTTTRRCGSHMRSLQPQVGSAQRQGRRHATPAQHKYDPLRLKHKYNGPAFPPTTKHKPFFWVFFFFWFFLLNSFFFFVVCFSWFLSVVC